LAKSGGGGSPTAPLESTPGKARWEAGERHPLAPWGPSKAGVPIANGLSACWRRNSSDGAAASGRFFQAEPSKRQVTSRLNRAPCCKSQPAITALWVRSPEKAGRESLLRTPWGPQSPGEACRKNLPRLLAGGRSKRPHRSRQLGSVPAPLSLSYRKQGRRVPEEEPLEPPSPRCPATAWWCQCEGSSIAAAIAISEGLGVRALGKPGEVVRARAGRARWAGPAEQLKPPRTRRKSDDWSC